MGNALDPIVQPTATQLIIAASRRDRRELRRLLERPGVKVRVNVCDALGMTPLHASAQYGQWDTAMYLLQHRACINARDTNGLTPLAMAVNSSCYHQNADLVQLLLERAADLSLSAYETGETPLHFAAQNQRAPAIRHLLRHNADANATTTDGRTPLISSALGPATSITVLKCLVEARANVAHRGPRGLSILDVFEAETKYTRFTKHSRNKAIEYLYNARARQRMVSGGQAGVALQRDLVQSCRVPADIVTLLPEAMYGSR